jgi:AcrR family transcriptional regulator
MSPPTDDRPASDGMPSILTGHCIARVLDTQQCFRQARSGWWIAIALPAPDRRDMYVSAFVPSSSQHSRGRQPHQLPPGRHGLPRSFVASNQRDRILSAVAEVVSLAGYAEMSVEDIVVTAGVSRRTFYDHFKSKEDAFLAAYDAVVAQLVARVQEAFAANDEFTDRVRECLAAFLGFVASEPAFADMCIVEVMAAGPQAVERRNAAMRAFVDLIEHGAAEAGGGRRPPALTAETIVGGIYEVVYARILQGEGADLPKLLPDLAYSLLLPFTGDKAAAAERTRIMRSRPRAAAKPPAGADA